jgi:hypothetical protein
MATSKHTMSLSSLYKDVSYHELTQKLIHVIEMELAAVGTARQELKKLQEEVSRLQEPFETEKAAIIDALRRHMLAIGSKRIRHELFTFSVWEETQWDKDMLMAMLPEIPALEQCVSQVPRSRLVPKA